MGKFKFTFTNILFWVAVISAVLVFENITFFEKVDSPDFMVPGMQDPYFFMFFAISVLSFVLLIVYETIFNKTKINIMALVVCLTLLACGIIGIWLFDGMEFDNGAAPIVIDDWNKIKHTMSFALFVLTIYSTIFYFTKNHPSIRRLKYLFLIVIAVTYFFVIYSIVTEYAKYEIIANADSETVSSQSIQSLFLNPNMFAGFILMGICAAIGLNYFKKNPLSYITIVGFAIIQVFVCSLTCILVTLSVIFIYFLFEIIITFKKNFVLAMFKLGIMISVYVVIVLLFAMCQTFDVPHLSSFCRFLYRELSSSNYNNFSNRTQIWEYTIQASSKEVTSLLFGYGFRNSEYITGGLINDVDHKISCHNGYLQILLNFGIVGLACFAIFVGVYFYSLIRLFKRHKRFCLLFFTIGLAYFALSCTESLIAFNASAQGILIGALFYLPVINRYAHLKNRTVGDSVVEEHSHPSLLEGKLMVRGSARFVLSLMAVVAMFFAFDECRLDQTIFWTLINAEAILGIFLLTFPYLNALWAKDGNIYKYLTHFMIFALLVAGASIGLAMVVWYGKPIDGFVWATPITISFIIFGEIIIYSVMNQGSFKLFLNTFVGFKTSLGSLIGAGALFAGLWFTKDYMIPYSLLTYLLTGLAALLVFYSFSFIAPFKDTMEIVRYVDEFDASLMKIDVIRDRLEESYEI